MHNKSRTKVNKKGDKSANARGQKCQHRGTKRPMKGQKCQRRDKRAIYQDPNPNPKLRKNHSKPVVTGFFGWLLLRNIDPEREHWFCFCWLDFF